MARLSAPNYNPNSVTPRNVASLEIRNEKFIVAASMARFGLLFKQQADFCVPGAQRFLSDQRKLDGPLKLALMCFDQFFTAFQFVKM